jgi:hypothetical protein
MKLFVIASASLLLASPAFAQSGTTSGGTAALPDNGTTAGTNTTGGQPATGDHLVCRRLETDPSSHMSSHRECHTAQEWRAMEHSR